MKGKKAETDEVLRIELPLDVIDPNPDNSEIFNMEDIDALADSIKRNGFRGAIEVFQKKDGRYEILAGHRRYVAAQKAGLSRIPCLIYMQPKDEIEKRSLLIDSNIYNREFTPLDKARALNYQRETFRMEQEKNPNLTIWDSMMKHFGMSRGSISTYLSIVELIPELQEMYAEQILPVYIAPTLASKAEDIQKKLWEGFKKLVAAQKPDADGKKRLSVAQINIVIERAEEEYTEEQLGRKEPQARVQDHYFDASTLVFPKVKSFSDHKDEEEKTSKKEKKNEGEKAFESLLQNNPFASNPVPVRMDPQPAPIIMEEEEAEDEKKNIPPIDTAFEMLTIQVKNLIQGGINVLDKEKAKANISSIRLALNKLESEL